MSENEEIEDATILPDEAVEDHPVPATLDDSTLAEKTDDTPAETEEEEEDINPYDYPAEPLPMLRVEDISLDDIADLENVRPEDYGIDELAESMYAQSQLHPVCVRPAAEDATHGKKWELVYGYRRRQAAQQLGWDTIRAIVREVPDERLLEVMLTENKQRQDMSPMQEARAIYAMKEYGEMNQSEIARRLGVSRSHISHRLKLLELAPSVMELLDSGKLSASAGEVLVGLPANKQVKVAKRAASDGMSVERISNIVRVHRAEEESDTPDDEITPLETLKPADVIDLPFLPLRDDLSDADYDRLACYALLRNGMDMEMLEYLKLEQKINYDQLWDWVRELSDPDAKEFQRRLLRRYIESAHRLPKYEPTLIDDMMAEGVEKTPIGELDLGLLALGPGEFDFDFLDEEDV